MAGRKTEGKNKIKYTPARILGIETSCDETSASVVENGRAILSNVVASQIELHSKYGGVFPEVASRQHILTVYPVVEQALQQAHLGLGDVDAIAVTRGPGLAGSLVVGLNMAKGLSLGKNIPLVGTNHLEAHLYSAWVYPADIQQPQPEPKFPIIALLVSGGHTELNLMQGHLKYQHLGGTTDDAAGEAFDKVARLLGLEYPGGPALQKAAEGGDPEAYHFPRARTDGQWDFSFSGLKTAVLRTLQKLKEDGKAVIPADLAASFQAAVTDVLFAKTMEAAREFKVRQIIVAGGVSANSSLRETFLNQKEFPVNSPNLSFCTDNAAMVAAAGYFRFVNGQRDGLDMDVIPNWPLH
jgi:N6-L-threonylcarbamoyladenine synthase